MVGGYTTIHIRVTVMVFNATFNNISVISRGSVLLVEDTGEPRENYWPVANH
jgi:ADP-ribose pyrophosphatase YjhB (NUDIX family)